MFAFLLCYEGERDNRMFLQGEKKRISSLTSRPSLLFMRTTEAAGMIRGEHECHVNTAVALEL